MIFDSLNEAEAEELSGFLKKIALEKGAVLFRPDEKSNGAYFLVEGKLAVQTETGFEDKKQVIALLDPGAVVGEGGLVERPVRTMTVFAIERSLLYHLSVADFQTIEQSHPKLAIKLLKKILLIASIRLQSGSNRLAHVL